MSPTRLALWGLVLSLACAPPEAGAAAVATATEAPTRPVAPTAAPAVLWTSPPTAEPTPRPAPTLAPAPIAAPATPLTARMPSPTATPSVRPSPSPSSIASPSADPFRWTRYPSSPGDTVIYLPSTWTPLAPAIYAGRGMSFAASPEGPSRPFDDYAVLGTWAAIHGPTPFSDVDAFADFVQRQFFSGAVLTREAGTHPSGAVVFLKYVIQVPGHPLEQQTDALFVSGGLGWIMGLRSPVDRLTQNGPVFQQIFLRFRPA